MKNYADAIIVRLRPLKRALALLTSGRESVEFENTLQSILKVAEGHPMDADALASFTLCCVQMRHDQQSRGRSGLPATTQDRSNRRAGGSTSASSSPRATRSSSNSNLSQHGAEDGDGDDDTPVHGKTTVMSYFSGFGSSLAAASAGGAATGFTPSKDRSTHSTPNIHRDRSTNSLDSSSHAFAFEGFTVGRLGGDRSDRTDSSSHAEVNPFSIRKPIRNS